VPHPLADAPSCTTPTCRRTQLCHTHLQTHPVVPHPLADAPSCATPTCRRTQLYHTHLQTHPVVPHPLADAPSCATPTCRRTQLYHTLLQTHQVLSHPLAPRAELQNHMYPKLCMRQREQRHCFSILTKIKQKKENSSCCRFPF
jgi:hypothetical protein